MDLKTIFLLICICSIALAVPTRKAPSQDEVFGPSYDFQGECYSSITKENYYCLPHREVTFNDMFNIKYLDIYLRDIEYWFMKNPYQKAPLEIKRMEDGKFGVFAKEPIKANLILYQENYYDRFNHTCVGKEFWEPNARIADVLANLPTINFTKSNTTRFIFTLLIHLYNLPVSKTRTILRLLPPVPDVPLFTLTPYEQELLKIDMVYNKYVDMHKRVKVEYDYMIKTMKASWSEEEIESVFKFSDIPYDDFVYAYFVTMSKTTSRGPKFKEDLGVIYLPLGTLYYRGKPGKRANLLVRFNREADDFAVQAIDDMKKGEEVFLPVTAYDETQLMELGQGKEEENCHFFLKLGFVPEVNKRECITLFLMEPQMAELWGLPSDACVNGLSNRLMAYHAIGNLMNMNEEEYKECEKLIFDDPKYNLTYAGPEEEKIRIFEVCKHVPWKKFNIFEKGLIQLEEMIEKYQKRLIKVEKYIALREKQHLSSKNAKLIYEYLESRHDLAKQIKLNIDNMILNPKKYKQEREEL